MAEDFDSELRREAMAWLAWRTHDGTTPISSSELLDFLFRGRPFRLMDSQRGIRKPAEMSSALSIRTTYRPPGHPRPYEDRLGADGLLRYKWRGEDRDHAENRALRAAMWAEQPIIWFFGVGDAMYLPRFPVFLLYEESALHQFVLDPDVARGLIQPDTPVEEHLKRYIVAETKRRLHQPVFRASVIRAYAERCAVCALHHPELLDAAHIVPDREEAGIASVNNGMAMCKIHHAAYDARILGVRPDLVVEIRADLLDEVDGPMLQHGLQGRHRQPLLQKPTIRAERPDPQLLEVAYERFRRAS